MDVTTGLMAIADQVAPAALVFARVSGLFMSGPVIGGNAAPMQVKAILALAVTIALAPTLPLEAGLANGWLYALALGKEMLVGVAIGFFFDIFFEAIRFGADLIGRQAGFSAAEYFEPTSESMSGPLGTLFHTAMVLLFFGVDGHHQFILALQRSYELVPAGTAMVGERLAQATASGADQVSMVAISFAFPAALAIMALTVVDGVVARAVPQINLLMITFIQKILVTMVLLIVGMPMAISFMGAVLVAAREFAWGILPLLR